MAEKYLHTITILRQINDHTWEVGCSCGQFTSGPRSQPYEAIGAVNKHIKKSTSWGERLWNAVINN